MSAYLTKQNELIYIGEFQEPYLVDVTITAEKSFEYLRDIDKNRFAIKGIKYQMAMDSSPHDAKINWKVIESEYLDNSSLGCWYAQSETKGSAIHKMLDAGFTVKVDGVEITKDNNKNNNFFDVEMMYRFINETEENQKLFKEFCQLHKSKIETEKVLKPLFTTELINYLNSFGLNGDEYDSNYISTYVLRYYKNNIGIDVSINLAVKFIEHEYNKNKK